MGELGIKSSESRRKILESAVYCLARIGVEKASISAIAEKSGKSRGLVAHYFPKKSELFPTVIRHIVDQFGEGLHKDPDVDSPLFKSVRFNLKFFIQHRDYFSCMILFYYYSAVRPEYRILNTNIIRGTLTRLSKEIAFEKLSRGVTITSETSDRLAEMIQRYLIGALQHHFGSNHGNSADQFSENVVHHVREILQIRED